MSSPEELIAEFMENRGHTGPDPWSEYCCRLGATPEAALQAAWSRDGDPEKPKKHPHQWRLNNDVLKQVGESLKSRWNDLVRCEHFDQILSVVEANRLKGFGELAIYDTALRVGHLLNHLPERVYLHAGVRDGARTFRIEHAASQWIEVGELPSFLQGIEPFIVEEFLCIYKDGELKGTRGGTC